MSQHFVQVQQASKRFPQGRGQDDLTVFENVNFNLEKGEFVCIIGHSGCGKSTILNALAGLDQFTDGGLIMEGHEVTGPGLERGVVFQNYSLLPWLTALENVKFGVRARWKEWPPAQVDEHSRDYLSMVGLDDVIDRKPSQLSGGMRQRVSIARTFATKPKLLLLDEPFGALDALTRGVIQDELIKIWGRDRQTVFMITHDVDEAILLADRILLMTNGPEARIAEAVEIDLPRPRSRAEVVKHPHYYRIRNYLIDFLVNRSSTLRTADIDGRGLSYPQSINPARADADSPTPDEGDPANHKLVNFTPKETHHG
ncbi:nitrate/nitrite transport system ATP-binding protein [Halomonas ventosae]|uniref:Nitrate/nitrite transport system ATP-binding protein n=1 Tax=Halomonas ventosae TaxID=229007 RepID=A0A4R6ZUW1_9GAMM|nr:ABC transporter ATP-binding protein [Halomonas ventosae]TDR56282.1 nitrate/nitrite transport system ATP-binding protein [Halomonas ventosae]